MTPSTVRLVFAITGVYDFVLGLGFVFFGPQLFEWAEVPRPNHWGYLQFGAYLLAIFGIMFFTIAYDPVTNRNLIPFGMLLKLGYAVLVGYYWFTTDCPLLFKPFAVIDALMFVLFVLAYRQLGVPATQSSVREQPSEA